LTVRSHHDWLAPFQIANALAIAGLILKYLRAGELYCFLRWLHGGNQERKTAYNSDDNPWLP
jgi:hypothetical protein